MDERAFEMAEALAEAQRQRAIESRTRYEGVSAIECEFCGTDIPQARRRAVPGCKYCVDCQSITEKREVRR